MQVQTAARPRASIFTHAQDQILYFAEAFFSPSSLLHEAYKALRFRLAFAKATSAEDLNRLLRAQRQERGLHHRMPGDRGFDACDGYFKSCPPPPPTPRLPPRPAPPPPPPPLGRCRPQRPMAHGLVDDFGRSGGSVTREVATAAGDQERREQRPTACRG